MDEGEEEGEGEGTEGIAGEESDVGKEGNPNLFPRVIDGGNTSEGKSKMVGGFGEVRRIDPKYFLVQPPNYPTCRRN